MAGRLWRKLTRCFIWQRFYAPLSRDPWHLLIKTSTSDSRGPGSFPKFPPWAASLDLYTYIYILHRNMYIVVHFRLYSAVPRLKVTCTPGQLVRPSNQLFYSSDILVCIHNPFLDFRRANNNVISYDMPDARMACARSVTYNFKYYCTQFARIYIYWQSYVGIWNVSGQMLLVYILSPRWFTTQPCRIKLIKGTDKQASLCR